MKVTHLHRAAREENLDAIKDANRKECNAPDEDGMTPTLFAAAHGKLEALRLLVGRGGDPDKCDFVGNSALHWASQNGHINCVRYLLNFGVNLWTLDNSLLTAREVAAMKGQQEILRLLDAEDAKQCSMNKKHVQALKEKATKDAEKRIKKSAKIQKEATKMAEKRERELQKERETGQGKNGTKTNQVEHRNPISFSELINAKQAPIGAGIRNRITKLTNPVYTSKSKVKDTASLRSLPDYRSNPNVASVPKLKTQQSHPPTGRKTVEDINSFQTRVKSESDISYFGAKYNPNLLETLPTPVFDGSITGKLSRKMPVVDNGMINPDPTNAKMSSDDEDSAHGSEIRSGCSSVSSDISQLRSPTRSPRPVNGKHRVNDAALETFLMAHDLCSCLPYLRSEQFDLDALLLVTESELKELGIAMGLRKKMMDAIERRRRALNNAGDIHDSKL